LHSTQNRKNPQGAVQAFMQFAQNKPDAYFILKINRWQNMDRKALAWLPNDARIKLVTDTLKPAELADLYQSANCYLSLHRSEGFGRTLVEALQHGLTLIATNYSGPADYITPQNSQIVEWLPQTVRKGDYPFNHFSMWADPIISQATSALQTLYQNQRGQPNTDSIASGNAYTVENLAAKYRGVIASYLH
jgi:glycosyltransferase involved in cell wall biosynthesis